MANSSTARIVLPDEAFNEESRGRYFIPQKPLEFIPSGCRLLDCVLGGGWPLSRISNIVGDKCLSGDTIVSAQRGTRPRKMTMQTLFNRARGNHPNRNEEAETFLLSDVGGYVGMGRMLDIVMSGEKVLYEITNDRGHSIKASQDHKFATSEGWQCLSDDLRIGSAVKCWRGTRGIEGGSKYKKKPRAYTDSIPYHPFGNQHIVAGRNYKRLLTSRLVIEAAINSLWFWDFIRILRNEPEIAATLQYTDPGLDVHHLDNDPTNNHIDNLELIEPYEHWHLHGDEMAPNTRKLDLSEITSIRRVGEEATFDITMEGPHHNFIANNFEVHNSTCKTLLAIEATNSFVRKYPNATPKYREAEAAFDQAYAASIGMPIEKIDFGIDRDVNTVEDFYADLAEYLKELNGEPGLYILDSLDALSSESELKRDFNEGSYSMEKAKQMGQIFRRLVRDLKRTNTHLMIISQERDNIGVTFGKKSTRSGGRALDFFASQCLWLAKVGTNEQTIGKVKRPISIDIRAKAEKNKVSIALRQCDFTFRFNFGIDELQSYLDWLESVGRLELVLEGKGKIAFKHYIEKLSDQEYWSKVREIGDKCVEVWQAIEADFAPPRKRLAEDPASPTLETPTEEPIADAAQD
jgi:RecA/RadA recombinase